jgi:hypothetical protein
MYSKQFFERLKEIDTFEKNGLNSGALMALRMIVIVEESKLTYDKAKEDILNAKAPTN